MGEGSELGAPPPVDPVEVRAAEARLLSRLLPGRKEAAVRIGRYRVLDKLGKGAHGVVYSAYDPQLDRRVAIKLLERTERAGPQILREARMLAKLSHPNIVTVYEVGEHDDDVFVAMEFVRGQTLEQWLAAQARSPTEIVRVFAAAADGLTHAHEHGVVHRDFKPANVMVESGGRVRVMDFGLARVVERALETSHDASTPGSSTTWSSGTPAYMAPEQHSGEPIDARSDQYALCLAAVEALLGAHPFDDALGSAAAEAALYEAKLEGSPSLPVPTMGLSRRQVRALRRGLAPKPEDRWPDMAALARALRPRPLPAARLIVGAFVVGAAAASVPLLLRDDPCSSAGDSFATSWNEAARNRLTDALTAAGPTTIGATTPRLLARIDEHAQGWIETARTICRADLPSSLERARTQCLEVEQARFEATLELLGDGELEVAQRAHELILGLPDPRWCEGTDVALSHVDEGGEVLELRRRLARASARASAGRFQEAADMFESMRGAVARDGTHAVIAEFEVALADVFRALGDSEAAHGSGLEAIAQSAASERWDLLAAAATVLSYVLGEQLGRTGEGLAYARIAVRIAEGHGVAAEPTLIAHLHLAGALMLDGDEDAAFEAYLETAERARAAGLPLTEAAALADRAALSSRTSRLDDAVAAMKRALEISWEVRGYDHPEDAVTRLNLGTVLTWQGRDDEAESQLRRARRIFVESYGEDHEDVARVDQALGNLLVDTGRLEDALVRYRAAYSRRRGATGPRARLASATAIALASTLVKLDRHDEAWPLFEEGLADSEGVPMYRANAHKWYGEALRDVGRDDEAEAHLRKALELQRELEPRGRQTVLYIRALGRHLVEQREYEEADALLAEVWPRLRDDSDYTRSMRGELAWHVARIRSHQGKACEAWKLATEALAGFEADPNAQGADAVVDWLAAHPQPAGCEAVEPG